MLLLVPESIVTRVKRYANVLLGLCATPCSTCRERYQEAQSVGEDPFANDKVERYADEIQYSSRTSGIIRGRKDVVRGD